MTIHTDELSAFDRGDTDVVDITAGGAAVVEAAGVDEGQALVFVRGSTAAIATMEFEPGGVHDLREMLERLIPTRGDYEHNRLNHDTNSHAHQRATVVGPSEAVPIVGGRARDRHLAADRADRLRRPPARADRRRPGLG